MQLLAWKAPWSLQVDALNVPWNPLANIMRTSKTYHLSLRCSLLSLRNQAIIKWCHITFPHFTPICKETIFYRLMQLWLSIIQRILHKVFQQAKDLISQKAISRHDSPLLGLVLLLLISWVLLIYSRMSCLQVQFRICYSRIKELKYFHHKPIICNKYPKSLNQFTLIRHNLQMQEFFKN